VSIISYKQVEAAGLVTVTVTSDLAGTVYYHWWRDGDYCGKTEVPRMTFYVAAAGHAVITVADTNDAEYDYVADAPYVHTATRTLYWTATTDPCAAYLVEQQEDGGDWEEIARVPAEADKWEYHHETGRLTDLATYSWRITPVDGAGQEGTATTIGPEVVVRVPDAPTCSLSFDDVTARITIAEAA